MPSPLRKAAALNTRSLERAIESWFSKVGFEDTKTWHQAYSRKIRWQRTVVTGTRPSTPEAYATHNYIKKTAYLAGESF